MQRAQPWFVGATLRALARHVQSTRTHFTAIDAAGWDDALAGRPGMARLAFARLEQYGMVERVEPPPTAVKPLGKVEPRWQLTAKGLGTCRAVLQAQPGNAPDPKALSTRLWALLHARRMLTAEDAASTLIDAGERDFRNAQKQLAGYLRAWAALVPDVVKVSEKRINGCKRYVLVKDGGIHPPPTKAGAIAPQPAPKVLPAPTTTGSADA